MEFTILNALVNKLEDKLAKSPYNKFEFKYSKGKPYICEDKNSNKYHKEVVDINIEGKYQINNYEFVASLEYNDELGMNIIKKSPDTENIPEEFISRSECDHCKIKRARKYTVLLKNKDTNEYVQIGKSCLKEYLGVDVENSAAYFSAFDSLQEYIDNLPVVGNGIETYFDVDEVLNQACAEVRVNGYKSKAQVNACIEKYGSCNFDSTASVIFYMMNQVTSFKGILYTKRTIEEVDYELKLNVKNYIADHFEDSDYIKSLFVLVNSEYVSNANLGLLVSAVGTYIRYITEKKEQENKIESEYIGNIGDKISFTCKPELIFSGDSVYGAFYIYKFKDGGNVITWKTNKAIDCDSEVEFIATVKNHSVYRNEKQTEVSRVKIK